MTAHDDGVVSEEFKKKVEELCDRLAPKNKENNALWQLVSEICKDNERNNSNILLRSTTILCNRKCFAQPYYAIAKDQKPNSSLK